MSEPASRALDTEIYCVIHRITDGNDLSSPALIEARLKGDVLIVEPGLQGWVEAPPFTGELKYAKSLVPEGLYTISSDARVVCSTALSALAMTDAPPLPHHGFLNESRA